MEDKNYLLGLRWLSGVALPITAERTAGPITAERTTGAFSEWNEASHTIHVWNKLHILHWMGRSMGHIWGR